MKTQWQIYQALELIPDAVPRPKTSLWAHLLKPLRRSLSNSFVRELADRHRIFLFNRCLEIKDVQPREIVSSKVLQWSKSVGRSSKLQIQQPPNQSHSLWWDGSDAR
jgi:hypothetical protein